MSLRSHAGCSYVQLILERDLLRTTLRHIYVQKRTHAPALFGLDALQVQRYLDIVSKWRFRAVNGMAKRVVLQQYERVTMTLLVCLSLSVRVPISSPRSAQFTASVTSWGDE